MANRLPFEKRVQVISSLLENASIRGIERMTGIHRDTVMRIGVRIGEACWCILDDWMRDLDFRDIQLDEIWGFVGKKNKNLKRWEERNGAGDVWTFIALDRESKVVPSFLVGKRDSYHATAFLQDLAGRLKQRPQLSSDALVAYAGAVERGFGSEVDYGQIEKTFSVVHLGRFKEAASRYSPAQVVRIQKNAIYGNPVFARICTSHIEKQNHTVRMQVRRLSRLTNAFSKKLDNFKAAMALYFAYYNFCKIHSAIRCTPAMEAGIEPSQWSVSELVERCGG